jgi:PDZ domain
MADARLMAALALAAASVAWGANPCEEDRGRTGVALAAGEGGLHVAAVDPDSPGAGKGLRAGDSVAQVNDVVPRSCADWGRAVRAARKDGRALLVLVRRDGDEVALALPASTWERAVVAVPPPPPVEPPSVREIVEAPPPPPLPPETQVTFDEVTHGLAALPPANRLKPSLDTYRRDLLHVHRQIETLAVRKTVSPEVVEGLRTVLRYYDAAEIAWDAAEAERESQRRPSHLPIGEALAAPYFTDGEAASTIDEFPFLHATVEREPRGGLVQSSGTWRPLEARQLLWQHGQEELDRLTAWLAKGPG